MSNKDKDSKALEKLKQFFRFHRGGSGIKPRECFSLTPELEESLSSESPLSVRIKTMKELQEPLSSQRLETEDITKLCCLLEDLLSSSVTKENRNSAFSFFKLLVQGQFDRVGLMREHFFKIIKSHNVPEDIEQRLDLLQSLTEYGKQIVYLEDEIGPFLLEWMPIIIEAGKEHIFLEILINVIKYNASYIDEDVICGLVEIICKLCCGVYKNPGETVVLKCLQVLDTIVCYTNLPPESLPLFIATLCRTVNIEYYCSDSWKTMKKLLGTHLGHSSLYLMCRFLSNDGSLKECGLLRGAVFYINMALWSNKKITSLKCTPAVVLPYFLAALRCNHTVVMYEVILSIQNLIKKHGTELLDPTWYTVIAIINSILKHTEERPSSPTVVQVKSHLHETLTSVEQLIEIGQFNGTVQSVFDVIERCSAQRPETSVLRLVGFIASSINPTCTKWLEKLDGLMVRFFMQETRPNIRIKVLSIVAKVIESNRRLFEKDLIKIVVDHLSGIADEPDIAVRSAAAQLLVDLCLNSSAEHSLEIMDIMEKLLNRAFDNDEVAKEEEEAEDVKMTAHGLVQALHISLYQYPPTPAKRAFTLITSHLEAHYTKQAYLRNVTSIRNMMLESILKLRADSRYRIGLVGHTPMYSMYLLAQNPATMNTSELMTLPINLATRAILKALKCELDWKVLLLVLQEIPNMLKNKSLLVSDHGSDVDLIANALCTMICDKSLNLPDVLKNTPPKFTRSDFQNYVFPVLASLVPYHAHLEPTLQQRLIKCLECGLASRSARQCVLALTVCILEMRDAMVKLLPEVLLNLSKISATVHIAIPILEFLSTLTQLPTVFANFVGDQYMSVFAISLPYTNPFKYHHYTVSLAHHVIAAWFLKCRLPFRRDFVRFIIKGLKANILLPFEEGQGRAELINEDSTNRKRSSSLTEPGNRKRERQVATRLELKAPDDSLMAFHWELTETCIDLMAMYTYSTCSPVPKRQSTAEMLFSGGQSMTWLLGNKLITVTTSSCTLKALKHGLCDRCYQVCRVHSNPDQQLNSDNSDDRRSKSKSDTASTNSLNSPDEEKSLPGHGTDHSKVEQPMYGFEKQERQTCSCWCKGWAEIQIRRPTGIMSWVMRLQNEPHSVYNQDLPNSDVSALFYPSLNSSKSLEEQSSNSERVCSEPMSIPGSPVRRNTHPDFDELEGSGRNRNPVRRSNSSPEMSASWKNPLLIEPDDLTEIKKKQNYSKDLRVNCEAIPEEMGTTPPTCEALMLAPMDNIDTKPPVPTSPRLFKENEPRSPDPSALPPLCYKRDRGHTISVMSPVRKPGREWDLKPRSPKSKDSQQSHRSGVNPAFVFLQLYYSTHFGLHHEKPLFVTNSPSIQPTLKNLDWIPPYEVHKVGVLYVGPGQANNETEILRNQYGSPRYVEFLQRLGTLINLAEADRQHVFLGGLDTNGNDGKFAYIWQDDIMQVIFHVATLMPNSANDPQGNHKKLHIGNNYVTIVYNDSGEDYNFQTVKAQFNYAVVVVEPLEHGSNQVIVKARDELVQHICHTDYKIISDQSVAILARQLALHSNLASMIMSQMNTKGREPFASNWLERLRQIKRLQSKLVQELGSNEERSHRTTISSRRSQMDDFTEYT